MFEEVGYIIIEKSLAIAGELELTLAKLAGGLIFFQQSVSRLATLDALVLSARAIS